MSAIDTVVGITLRLANLEPVTRSGDLDLYTERVRTIIAAAKSWSEEMRKLADRLAQRPDLAPARTPSEQMPSPEGWLDEVAENPVCWWRLPDTEMRLTYTRRSGWGITHMGGPIPITYELGSLGDLGPALRELTESNV